MAKKNRSFSFSRSAKSLQENASNAGSAAGASYTLVGAIILLGGIGYAVDRWQGSAPWGLLILMLESSSALQLVKTFAAMKGRPEGRPHNGWCGQHPVVGAVAGVRRSPTKCSTEWWVRLRSRL
jgi:hypothetical protein